MKIIISAATLAIVTAGVSASKQLRGTQQSDDERELFQCANWGEKCWVGVPGIDDKDCCEGLKCEPNSIGVYQCKSADFDWPTTAQQESQLAVEKFKCANWGEKCWVGVPGIDDKDCCEGLKCEPNSIGVYQCKSADFDWPTTAQQESQLAVEKAEKRPIDIRPGFPKKRGGMADALEFEKPEKRGGLAEKRGGLNTLEECIPRSWNVPGYEKCMNGLNCVPKFLGPGMENSVHKCVPPPHDSWEKLMIDDWEPCNISAQCWSGCCDAFDEDPRGTTCRDTFGNQYQCEDDDWAPWRPVN